MSTRVLRFVVVSALAAMLLVMIGCRRVSGQYEPSMHFPTLNFKSSDKVDISMMGGTKETTYSVQGDKITIHPPQGRQGGELVFMIQKDGTLLSGDGEKFFKK